MTSRPSTAAPILAALAVVLVTVGAYVGGYFWLGFYHGESLQLPDGTLARNRSFRNIWLRTVFLPAGQVEGFVTYKRVYLTVYDPED